jgi:hypothetical protein
MAEEQDQIQGISAFLDSVLDPTNVDSLREEGAGEIELQIFNGATRTFESRLLRSMFPFMSIYDIKLAIYALMRQEDKALPEFTFLGRLSTIPKVQKFLPLDYQWVDSTNPKDTMRLANPTQQVGAAVEPNRKFVESSGERRVLGMTDKSRLLIEEEYKTVPTLYVFFYQDLLVASDLPKPIAEGDWNGRFWPYFPALSAAADHPTAEMRTKARKFTKAFLVRRQFYTRLEEVLTAAEPLLPLKMTGVRYLRLRFPKPSEFPGIERMFYQFPVSERRPYMRLMPAQGTPISKVHLLPSGLPNLEDPRLLIHWTQERNPTPERDYALAKILYRRTSGSISPLYFTLRLLDDGTADLTIEPPRGVRKLEPRSELNEADRVIQEGLRGLPHLRSLPQLGSAVLTFQLSMRGVAKEAITTAALRQRLGIFKSVFQEIAPLPGDTPLLMLRYKLVNNFFTEDRIGVFVTQAIARRQVKGEAILRDLPEIVAEEFQLDLLDARKRVAAILDGKGEVMAVDMESKEYVFHSNAGVDVAIYGQHPLYAFHLYRVDSVNTLRRVITFLSMLMSKSPAEVRVPDEAVAALEKVEDEEEEEAEEEAAAAAAAAPDSNDESEYEGEFGDIQDATEQAAEVGDSAVLPDYLQDFMFDGEELAGEETAAAANEQEPPVPPPPVAAAAAAAPKVNTVEPEEETEERGYTQGQGLETFFSNKLKEADRRLFDYTKTHPSAKKYVSQCQSNLARQPAVLNEEQYQRMMDEYEEDVRRGEVFFYVFPLEKKEAYEPPAAAEHYTLLRYGTSDRVQNYYLCCKYFCTRDYMLVREKDLRGTTLRRAVPQADGSMRVTKAPMTCPFCEGKVVQNRRFPGVNETVLERTVKPGTKDARHLYIKFLGRVYHPDGFHLPCCFTDDQPVRMGHPAFPEGPAAAVNAAEAGPQEEDLEEDTAAEPLGDIVSYEDVLTRTKFAYIVGAEKFPLEGALRKFARLREGEIAPTAKLVPPQIGLLPAALNTFFGQDTANLVSRTFNPQKIKPGAQGFLRVGVENRVRYKADSFLAAVAPFFGKNSVQSFKAFLADVIQPRVFMGLNHGNLLLEMYDAATSRPKPEEMGQVREWGRAALGVTRVGNQELLVRAFMAYRSFQAWLASDETVKEYRQFAHLFAQPGLLATATRRVAETGAAVTQMRRPGILFIVLDLLKSGEVRVRCPPYPMAAAAFERADIGFLAHHWSGVWEPIFYIDNRSLGERDLHTFNLAFSATQRDRWPQAVKQRVAEFAKSCAAAGGGRGIYTSLSGIHSTRVLPMSTVRSHLAGQEGITLYGLVRDAYNHVAALVYQINDYAATETSGLVAVPVVDDGIEVLETEVKILLDWDEFKPAPIDAVTNFYRNFIVLPKFPKTYMPRAPLRSEGKDQIVALRLEGGLFVPVAPTGVLPENLALPFEEETVAEMEWEINKAIVENSVAGEAGTVPEGDETILRVKEMNEAYEHLRLTFSNWLASKEQAGEFRRALEEIIFRRDLPLYEKRKRLEIMLAAQIEPWLAESDEDRPRQASLLRLDCRLLDESGCKGMCEWRRGDEENPGKCLLHAPRGKLASGGRILLLRLIDELLRYAGRRKQIFEKRVSQLGVLENPVIQGEEGIFPEKSAAWIEMLRLEWARDTKEEARYLEEMSRLAPIGAAAAAEQEPEDEYQRPEGLPPGVFVDPKKFVLKKTVPAAAAAAEPPPPQKKFQFKRAPQFTELPAPLQALLNPEDPKTAALKLYPSPTGTLAPFLGLFAATEAEAGLAPRATEFTDSSIKFLVKKSVNPIIQYDMRTEPPTVIAKRLATDKDAKGYPVFVLREGLPPALVVTNLEAPTALTRADLPDALYRQFMSGIKVFGINLTKDK